MPVILEIHSSEVSTIFARSSLVRTCDGTAFPVPAMRARNISLISPYLRSACLYFFRVPDRRVLRDRLGDRLRELGVCEARRHPNSIFDGLGVRPPVAQ